MPWTKENLPDQIKVLPPDAQSIWIKAANPALKDNDEEAAVKIGWTAVKNAGFVKDGDKWIRKKMAKAYELTFEIFSVGTWNNDKYTEKDLALIKKNFQELKDEVKPPIKLGHQSQIHLDDGQPALGWVSDVWIDGKKLLAKVSNIPEVIYQAIKKKRYRRLSIEMFTKYKSSSGRVYNNVLAAIGLLGATIPAVSNLKDLEALFAQQFDEESFELKLYDFDFDSNDNKLIKIELEKESDIMDEKDKKILKLEQEKQDFETKQKALKLEKEASDKKLIEFKKEQDKKKKEANTKDFKAFCEKMVKDKRLLPAARDILVDPEKIVYSDQDVVISFKTFKTIIEQQEVILDTREFAQSGDGDKVDLSDAEGVGLEVDRLAKEYALKNKVEYDSALDAILADSKHKALADAYAGK